MSGWMGRNRLSSTPYVKWFPLMSWLSIFNRMRLSGRWRTSQASWRWLWLWMQRWMGWCKLQRWVFVILDLWNRSYTFVVCKNDDACIGFPLAGGVFSEDDQEVANMTCYKGGETVFNNHQMCDVTSTLFLYLQMYISFWPSVRPEDCWHASWTSTPGNF